MCQGVDTEHRGRPGWKGDYNVTLFLTPGSWTLSDTSSADNQDVQSPLDLTCGGWTLLTCSCSSVNIDQWTKMICKCIQSKPVSHLCPYQDMSGTNSTRKIRFCSTTGEQRVSNFQRFGVILSRFFDLPLHAVLPCASWRCSCPCTQVEVESVTGGLGPGSLFCCHKNIWSGHFCMNNVVD